MKPSLYNWYLRGDIERIAGRTAKKLAASDCFLISSKLLICLANTSSDQRGFVFSKPTELKWIPQDGVIDKSTGKLPSDLEKAFTMESCQKLLLATSDNANYMYTGTIDLTAVLADPVGVLAATFLVTPKLSRDVWFRFGSFSDWQLWVNGRYLSIGVNLDLKACLSQDWEASIVEIFLTRFEGDYLHLVSNGDFAFASYVDEAGRISLTSRNSSCDYDPEEIISFTGFGGSDWDVEARSVISKSDALQILFSFFQTGKVDSLVKTD
jgi:hypothetical protein